MRILVLGSDNKVLEKDSNSRSRMLEYSRRAQKFVIVVPHSEDVTAHVDERLIVHGVNATVGPLKLWNMYKKTLWCIKEYNIQVVSAQNPFEYGFIGWMLRKKTGVGLHVQEHGDFYTTTHWRNESAVNFVRYFLGKFVLQRADSIRVVSKRIAGTLEKKLGIVQDKMTVVAVNTPEQTFSWKAQEPFTFLAIGRMVKQKNFSLLLRAFNEVSEKHPEVHLRLVGDGKCMKDIHNLATAMELQDRVTFVGWSDKVEQEYERASAFVLSSNYEGWGRVVVEAAQHALPIVMTRVGCADEFIRHEKEGLLVDIGDQYGLAEAMKRVYSDTQRAQILGGNAQARAKQLPNKEQTITMYYSSWEKTL